MADMPIVNSGIDKTEVAMTTLANEVAKFALELESYLVESLNDKISEDEVLTATEKQMQNLILGYARRLVFDRYAEEFGPEQTAIEFDNVYYQIAARKIGPDDFTKRAKPYGRLMNFGEET